MRASVLLSALFCLAPVLPASVHAADPITLTQAMADPDWIGPAVDQAWWSWDGRTAYYAAKRTGSDVRDTWAQPIDGGAATRVSDAARATLDAQQPVYDARRTRMAFVRNGDVFVRTLAGGALVQLTRGQDRAASLRFGDDGALVWRVGDDRWFRWSGAGAAVQAVQLKAEDDPAKAPKSDALRETQLRLIGTLREEARRRDEARTQDRDWRRADGTRAPGPVFLGKDVKIAASALSPDGRWMVVATEAKSADEGQAGKMPKYVTESGYEEVEDVRTRVGRNDPVAQAFWLVDVAEGTPRKLDLKTLPGIDRDPLADLRRKAGKPALDGLRAVRLEEPGDGGLRWSGDSRGLALMLHAVDNKDRWLATVDLAAATLQPRHRLTDAAWINWGFNEFGWMPDNRGLWFLSEESGYSHLYVADGGRARAITSGRWEASMPALSADGRSFLFLCNRAWPGRHEVCRAGVDGGATTEVTQAGGIEDFALSPDGRRLLLRQSGSYLPAQVAVVDVDGTGDVKRLTDTRTAAFRARTWIEPEMVQVPSKHGAGTIWGKFYGPKVREAGRRYPVVLFVHGAGYLQNVSDRYPAYFREQMFHNLLVQEGYLVLDLDYRASEGYGRDWRTAIYRRMGHPELEDYLDGIDWLVAERQGDHDRVGIYGGSYGGFMTFMALFREPGTFKAGAALRPVSDWSQYNHEYTANILNTPELDPEAYLKSSPLEYAAGLQDPLLIAHGMIDDNVFYKDSVMLAQKLIELRKTDWELASYPLERHGFKHSDSWYDEYRRIHELFERNLRTAAP